MVISFSSSWIICLCCLDHALPHSRWVTGAPHPLGVKSVLGKAFCFAFRSLLSNALSDSAFSSSSCMCLARCSSLARCSCHVPATASFCNPPEQCGVEEGEGMSLCHLVIHSVSGCLHLNLTFQRARFPSGAAQLCPPALILVCAAHKL